MQISPALIVLAILAVLLIWSGAVFNGLVAQQTRVRSAWAEIDVQLSRRHDLIPNLVESVRGYMEHEGSALGSVTEARAHAIAAGDNVQQRAVMESALTGALGKFLVVAEKYPQLRAIEGVQHLQEQLISTENRIAYARQFYNDEVMKYNTIQRTFPRNLFSTLLGFSPSAMFVAADAERANVEVQV